VTAIVSIVLGFAVGIGVHLLLGGRPQTWWPGERGRVAFQRSAAASVAAFVVIVIAWGVLPK
jgi:hypothetical protein